MVGFYLPIAKIDREQRMVWGYASTPTRDLDGEVIALEAIRKALPDYMQWRNVREMHQPSAVGVAEEANIDSKGLYLGARIVDDEAWKKVLADVYKGFSIGGNVTEREGSTVTGLELIEISLVDRPANPDCRIEVIKAAKADGSVGAEAPGEEMGYADPGYLPDGRKRYPIDTEEHIRAAWNYIHQQRNAAEYTAEELAAIRQRIITAWQLVIDPAGPPAASKISRKQDGIADALPSRFRPAFSRVNQALGDSTFGDHALGVTRMAEGNVGKRAPDGAHAEHLKKAVRHLGEAHKCLGAGMACLASAGRTPAQDEGDDEMDAQAQVVRATHHLERAQEQHVLAHHHMAAALGTVSTGHAGERGEEPGDTEAGIYEPGNGLMPLRLDQMTGGNVPSYDVSRPYPGKAARSLLTKREADALAEAAYLRGKVEALEKMPSSPRAKLFAVPRGAFGVSEADEPSAMETLLKGVNLDAVEPAQRQAAGARLIGNMIANAGIFARPVIGDPSFRGGAGAGRSGR
jgi:phage head maturation protease